MLLLSGAVGHTHYSLKSSGFKMLLNLQMATFPNQLWAVQEGKGLLTNKVQEGEADQ